MKKFFGIGLLALLTTAYLTSSCSRDDLSGSMIEDKKNAFNDNFVAEYGEIDPNHDWGFGLNSGTRAFTRAGGAFADSVGAYPKANHWTTDGFPPPEPLTTSQKLRAQYYFQMNQITNPNRPDNGTKDFFMQQVYDGGTDPMAGKSPEKYPAADNNTLIESGEHMDHLTAGPNHLHVYNFNNGTCSPNPNVSDRDQTDVNDTGKQHTDQIQLMLNTPTSCFGYANSDASCVRDDRWTLVSAKTIDDFCDGDANFASWLAGKLAEGQEDKKCDDEFHRDFIGFDFDMMPDESCYAGTPVRADGSIVYDTYNQADEIDHYVYSYAQYGTLNEANDQNVFNEDGTVTSYSSWDAYIMIDGFKIPYVVANTNKYCAIGENANIGIGGMDGFTDYESIGAYDPNGTNDNTLYLNNLPGKQSDIKAINMKFIAKLVRAGYRPVADKGLKRWVKIGGCNDGYYSDWIVTFMPATSGDIPTDTEEIVLWQSGRVFCEDLGTVDISDIDYNDVVFDAWLFVKRKNNDPSTDVFDKCVIQLLAAGGTIPVQVAGVNVHDAFGVAEDVMVNTVKEGVGKLNSDVKHAEYGVDFNKMPDKIVITSPALLTGTDGSINIKNIPIVVRTSNTAVELTAENNVQGTTAPLKFMAPVGTAWAAERVKIGEAYPDFSAWVQNSTQVPWSNCVGANVCIDEYNGRKNLTFRTEDYCKAEWDADTSTFTWGQDNKGWDDAWTFMAAQGVSGDLSDWMLLHLKVSDFTNASAEKLTIVFKKNDGSTPPNGPTKEFVVSPDVLGNIDIPLYGVQWGNCDIKNIQDLTIYGCDRDDNTIPASVKVTEAYYVKF